MAKFSRIEVVQTMKNTGIVPVFYDRDLDVCKKVIQACYEGGARVFEFTNRGDFAHEVFGELNKYVNENFEGMILGIGSVFDRWNHSSLSTTGCEFHCLSYIKS